MDAQQVTDRAMRFAGKPSKSAKEKFQQLPGDMGMPLLGHTIMALNDPHRFWDKMRKAYGNIYRSNAFFNDTVHMISAEANELVLLDKNKAFSSELGWNSLLGLLFPHGLMLMDFEAHRHDRKLISGAFKTGPMKGYLSTLNAMIPPRVQAWGGLKNFLFYPEIKKLTLEAASEVFFGFEDKKTAAKVNKALTDIVAASVAVVRKPVPGTQMYRGVKGRAYLVKTLRPEVKNRRGNNAPDLFSRLCQERDDNGNDLDPRMIVDHMIFIWMAAHDTITSSLSSLVLELARHPDWQDRIRTDTNAALDQSGAMGYDQMSGLEIVELAMKEALRLRPPLPTIVRHSVKDTVLDGKLIPAGYQIAISPTGVHMDPSHWPNPEKFDPMRFTIEGGVKDRHKYAWVPFGGGAHMCIGLHFAYMMTKVIIAYMLKNFDITVAKDYQPSFQILPIVKPKDGLQVSLKALKS